MRAEPSVKSLAMRLFPPAAKGSFRGAGAVDTVADWEQSLGKLLCEHMVDSLAIYVVYIHELPPSFSVFVSHLPAGSASISTPVLQWIRNRSC